MRSRITWIGVVVGLLVMSLGIHAVLVVFAVTDPSFAIEEDYEAKAAGWDDVQREAAASARLGWALDVRIGGADVMGTRRVDLTLTDEAGAPVDGAIIALSALHVARAANVVRGEATATDAGAYTLELPMRRPGRWELQVEAVRADERFTKTIRKSVGTRP